MIPVQRGAKPKSLVDNAVTWTTEYQAARDAFNADPQNKTLKRAKEVAEAKYRQKDVQNALKIMFKDKCAFCERKRDYPHIEHFKPKMDYPALCFEWTNFVQACEVCNGASYKGVKFPLDANGSPLFINPCDEDPNLHIDFVIEPDANSENGFIARLKGKTPKGIITIQELGLNRVNLLKERNQSLLPYYQYIALKAREGDAQAVALLDKACSADFVFAAFARALRAKIVLP
jgi:uncharacterized protein (TIGR02646 family)